MPFPKSVRIDALVRSGRHCCVCHKFVGRAANVHHIIQEALGGPNTIDNAICLCPQCHSEAGHYNADHPLGIKYSPDELRAHRDQWWSQPALAKAPSDDAAALDAYALGILAKLDDPGLAVLAALAHCKASATVHFAKDPVPNVSLVALPSAQLVEGSFNWENPVECGIRVPWPWPILKETVQQLRDQHHLLHFHTVDGRGGFGSIYLSELGQMVTRSACFPTTEVLSP
jgi:hypothetical protein